MLFINPPTLYPLRLYGHSEFISTVESKEGLDRVKCPMPGTLPPCHSMSLTISSVTV